ncbi:MAG TPA: hypothetical protein VK386_06100 [Acidimicrobiales bacterium]|nr:hypothetical protein [Acidimicrobiales bacterium]
MPRDTTVRQRVTDYLVGHGELSDKSGRATSRLKEAVGYNGGDAGFIRIVSLMAEAGDIEREVRGKRTYRILLTDQGRAAARLPTAPSFAAMAPSVAATPDGELDYDELAAALLSRAARALTAAESAASGGDQAAWARRRLDQLEAKVVALQRDLARARAEVQAVTEERDELRAQLEVSARNLDVLTERLGQRQPAVPRAAEHLDSDEQALLRSLRRPQRSDSSTRAG